MTLLLCYARRSKLSRLRKSDHLTVNTKLPHGINNDNNSTTPYQRRTTSHRLPPDNTPRWQIRVVTTAHHQPDGRDARNSGGYTFE